MKTLCLVLNNREPISENVLDRFQDRIIPVWYQHTDDKFSLDDALEQNSGTQLLVSTYMELSREKLKRLPDLKGIIATTVAVEYIDRDYCKEKGIRVSNTPKYTGSSVAEYAFALMLAAARHLTSVDHQVRNGDFNCFEFLGLELAGKTAGIIGLGDIGSRVAKFAQSFDMDVLYFNRSQKHSTSGRQVELPTLLACSDVIFLTLPLNTESRSMIGRKEFSAMKKGAILVNVSPDEILDLDALVDALNKRQLYAALDLHKRQPSLLDTPNSILSPRRAWYTQDCFDRRVATWIKTLESYLDGTLINTVV